MEFQVSTATEITTVLPPTKPSDCHRRLGVIGHKSKMTLLALSIAVLGMMTTESQAAPSMQQQVDAMQRQLSQQQRVIEQQQQMMMQMQLELEKQRLAGEQALARIKSEDQRIKQQAAKTETTVERTAIASREIAKIEGIDLSKVMDQMGDTQGLNIKVPETDTVLTVSGFIRASSIHDFDRIDSPTKFAARHIVVDKASSSAPDEQTTFTANASRFVLGSTTPTSKGKLTTLLSWDFDDNTTSSSADIRLRQAWGQLDDILFGGDVRVGQVWTTWDDVEALPETMDFEGPNASQQNRQPLIRWARDYSDEVTLWLAVEDPDYSVTDATTESRWPDTIASLNWHGDWGHLKPVVMARQIRGDSNSGKSDSVLGWGAQLAGEIKMPLLDENDNFKFQVVYGAGIGSYNNDGGFDDALFNGSDDLKAIESFQGFGAFQHWWTGNLRSNAVFGWVNVDNRKAQTADSLDQTMYAAGNLVWSVVDQVDVGFEYLWGERKNKDNKSGNASRVQVTTRFAF